MLAIEIDKSIEDFVEKFYHELYELRRKDYLPPKQILTDLVSNKKGKQKELLLILIDKFDEIIKFHPIEQQALINELEKKDLLRQLYSYNHRKNKKPSITIYGTKILNAFKYSDFRSRAYKIIDELKIKSCVYCNAQLAINVDDGNKHKSRLQLDHFFSKDKYPFLSASFYNLIPCCSSCNQTKSNKKINIKSHFHLYSTNRGLNPFKFRLDNYSVLEYLLSKNKNRSKLKFEFSATKKDDTKFAADHDNLFNISGIYNTQKDIIEEQIIKSIYYDRSIQKIMVKEFSKLFIDESTIKRMVVGNYFQEKDIHKRPMSKFIQDISQQLDLL